jgi:hypothetical protein
MRESPGVVEGRPGGAAPALSGSHCGGATSDAAAIGTAAAATPATIAVVTTTATTTATPPPLPPPQRPPPPVPEESEIEDRRREQGRTGVDTAGQGWVKVVAAVHLRQRERWLSPTRP